MPANSSTLDHVTVLHLHSSSVQGVPVLDQGEDGDEKGSPEVTSSPSDVEAFAVEERPARKKHGWGRIANIAFHAAVLVIWYVLAMLHKFGRDRWFLQTIIFLFLASLMIFQFVPTKLVSQPIGAVWNAAFSPIARRFHAVPYYLRLGIGWLCVFGIVFSSAFGFRIPKNSNTTLPDRAISVLGLFLFQFYFWVISKHRKHIPWPTVVVGLFFQLAIALFVFKTAFGYRIFNWISILASDLMAQPKAAAQFFFDAEIITKQWFFINALSAIIFFNAFVQVLYYWGWMQVIIKAFASFFFATMNISGAEAVVAVASPWVGQGESACLVRPFVDLATDSELHLFMTTGFSTIAGTMLSAYIALGVPPLNIITSSAMSIPASIAISKMRFPEVDEPVTQGRVVVERGAEKEHERPVTTLHALSKGAIFGLRVAGQIVANLLSILAFLYTFNGGLQWMAKGTGIPFSIEGTFALIFYPISFLMGVPKKELLLVARLLGLKLYANELVAYTQLQTFMTQGPQLSQRAYTIATFALCGFANIGSIGIQIGVLTSLAPSKGRIIARMAPGAMLCGFICTMQTAAIAGMLV